MSIELILILVLGALFVGIMVLVERHSAKIDPQRKKRSDNASMWFLGGGSNGSGDGGGGGGGDGGGGAG